MRYTTHQDIIDAWPKPALPTFAADHGVKYDTAKGWRRRNSIPPERWLDTIRLAAKRGVDGVTHPILDALWKEEQQRREEERERQRRQSKSGTQLEHAGC